LMSTILFRLMVLSKFFQKKWKSSSRPKVNRTLLPPKSLVYPIGCMSQLYSTSLQISASLNLILLPKFSVYGKRMCDTENSWKPERNLSQMLFSLNQLFHKILWRSIDHCLIFNRIEPFQAEYPKTVPGKRQILTLSSKLSEKQHQINMKLSLLERWQTLLERFKTMFMKSVI
jgi:hypothetical protein